MHIREEYKKSLKMLEVEEFLDLVLYRPLALVFVRVVHRTPLTPNGITFLSFLSGLASAYSFAMASVISLARAVAGWKSGIWSSCNTIGMLQEQCLRCHLLPLTPAWGWNA